MTKWAKCRRQNQACSGTGLVAAPRFIKTFNSCYITPIGAKATDTSQTRLFLSNVGNGVKHTGKTRTTVDFWTTVSYKFRRLLGDKRTACKALNLRDVLKNLSRNFQTVLGKKRLDSIALGSNSFAILDFKRSSFCSTKACLCTP
jgi:hypothetical protein